MTEALNSDREIEKIILAKGAEGSIKKIEGKAKAKKIPLYYSDKSRMDRDADGGNHQGVIAVVSDYEYACWTGWRIPTIWELSCGRQNVLERMA